MNRIYMTAGVTILLIAGIHFSPAQGTKDADRKADAQAIAKTTHDFSTAFSKGDAKAVAGFWTAQGEYHQAGLPPVRGRQAIEELFAQFFKANPKPHVEALIESIRFLGPDLAIEEGVLRNGGAGKELPSTTLYSAIHTREGGQWKIALAREWGAGQHRLEDLGWLIGTWKATAKDVDVTLTFERDPKKPGILGHFAKKVQGKEVGSGTIKIAIDPQRGQIRSWHFDDDGGHAQALWLRDGNHWVLDSTGVAADGAEVAAVNLLGRLGPDEITWRSIDRVHGRNALPDSTPLKLARVGGVK